VDHAEYCRQIESYLCQKNGGHLIRIVGPAFERVCGWADMGVPVTIAYGGIDRYCERQQGKSGRRRPVRIEFCEADVLAIFDDWRRAVGIDTDRADRADRRPTVAKHVERVIARFVALRTPRSPSFERHVEGLIAQLDEIASAAKHARGAARAAIVDRLTTLDRDMIAAAMAEVDAASLRALTVEADQELTPFGSRMPPEARAQAREAAIQRLVRESLGLPTIRYE
jgi:hypothetical protein